MKCKECSGMGKISDCDIEGMWIEECKNCHGSGYICTRIADSLNDKALLADAKVGDLCRRRDGKWVQIDSLSNDRPCPIMCKSDIGGMDCFTLDGRNHNAVGDEKDIVSCEQLAPKGSAEWAWQMNKLLGKKVMHSHSNCITDGNIMSKHKDIFLAVTYLTGWQIYEPEPEPAKESEIVAHKQHANCLVCGKEIEGILDGHATVSIKRYSISSLYESTYSHYCGKCFLELGFDKTERELRNRQQPIAEPAFKVGDWVKYDIDSYLQVIEQSGKEITLCKTLSGVIVYPYTSCLTKVSPSEVIINIGCLSGRIEALTCNCCKDKVFVLLLETGGFIEIPFSALDEPTSKLVNKLLKAQEELCQ